MRSPARPSGRWVVLIALAAVAACGLAGTEAPPAQFVREIPWAATGVWIPVDTHVHTRFSDGGNAVAEVLEQARRFGCRAIAITDHADRQLGAATPEYQAAIEAAREASPGFPIVAGLEWNVPPRGGDEHATVLVPDGPQQWDTLAEFKRRFDDFDLEGGVKPDVAEALRWLATRNAGDLPAVVIYNHPSRKDESAADNVADVLAWHEVNGLVVGFEGAPGHQGDDPVGSYDATLKTVDRWDPVAAEAGGAWDTLLLQGLDLHGASANSDFHSTASDLNDRWPCQFSETWLFVPEVTTGGVLRALRANVTYGVHGRIARDVALTVRADGLSRPAMAGETVEASAGSPVTAALAFKVPETDWEERPNHIDGVEFIVTTPDGTVVIERPVTESGPQMVQVPLTVGVGGLVIRARGRRVVEDGPDLMFYTNAIRVIRSGGP